MSEKVYEFKTVVDFLQLTEEQFKRFLPDFIHWFILRKNSKRNKLRSMMD